MKENDMKVIRRLHLNRNVAHSWSAFLTKESLVEKDHDAKDHVGAIDRNEFWCMKY